MGAVACIESETLLLSGAAQPGSTLPTCWPSKDTMSYFLTGEKRSGNTSYARESSAKRHLSTLVFPPAPS